MKRHRFIIVRKIHRPVALGRAPINNQKADLDRYFCSPSYGPSWYRRATRGSSITRDPTEFCKLRGAQFFL